MLVQVWGAPQAAQPFLSWDEAVQSGALAPGLRLNVGSLGWAGPVPAQRFWPHRRDVLLEAPAGSGRTTAALLTVLSRIIMEQPGNRPLMPGIVKAFPRALLVGPSKESVGLVAQRAQQVLQGLQSNVKVLVLHEGEPPALQRKPAERQAADLVVATPGRLQEALDTGALSLSMVRAVVFDEAEALDGATLRRAFEGRDLSAGGSGPTTRQTIILSSGLKPQASSWLAPWLQRPPADVLSLRIVPQMADCSHVQQRLEWVEEEEGGAFARIGEDLKTLFQEIEEPWRRAIVFVDDYTKALALSTAIMKPPFGFRTALTCGRRPQDSQRIAQQQFSEGACDVLIAVGMAPGFKLGDDVGIVLQAELPTSIEVYAQRAATSCLVAQAYASGRDRALFGPLADLMQQGEQQAPLWLQMPASELPGGPPA